MKYEYITQESEYQSSAANFMNQNKLGKIDKNIIIYAAITDNQVVGLATLKLNPLHPYAYHLNIKVNESFNELEVGTKLIDDLSMDYDKQFRVGVNSDDDAVDFFISQGFIRKIRCYLPEYEIDDLKSLKFDTNYNVMNFSQLNDEHFKQAQRLLHRNYVDEHFYNPLDSNLQYFEFTNEAMEDYNPERSFAIISGTKVIGYLIAFDAEDKLLEIGYIGKDYSFEPSIDGEFYSIIKMLFDNYKLISFEVDDVNKQGMDVLNMFKELPKVTWDVYFKRK